MEREKKTKKKTPDTLHPTRTSSLPLEFDPNGGHGYNDNKITCHLGISRNQLKALKEFYYSDLPGFLWEIERQLFWELPNFEEDKHRGGHKKTHSIEGAIRSLATRIYAITDYWKGKEAQPESFSMFIKIVNKHRDKYTGSLMDEPEGIMHISILESSLGKLARKQGLRLYQSQKAGKVILRTEDFCESYLSIETPVLQQSTTRNILDYLKQADPSFRERLTDQCIKLWQRDETYWLKLTEL